MELGQAGDFDEAVVVAVVVDFLGGDLLGGVVAVEAEDGEPAGGDGPGGVVSAVPVHILVVPVGVDAGVAGGYHQLGSGLGGAVGGDGLVAINQAVDIATAGFQIPVAVADGAGTIGGGR